MEADKTHEEPGRQMILTQDAAPSVASAEAQKPELLPADDGKKVEELGTKLHAVERELSEKSHMLEQLQKKFSDLEKEYTVLYQQQQNQQG